MARKATNGPSIEDVRAAAAKLKGGKTEDARAVFEMLAQVKGYDAADVDSVIEALRFVLGKTARVPTLRLLAKEAAMQRASKGMSGGGAGVGRSGAPPSGPTATADPGRVDGGGNE